MAERKCPIWGSKAGFSPSPEFDGETVLSNRAGGWYRISRRAIVNINHNPLTEKQKAMLTTWVVDKRNSTDEIPCITESVVESAKTAKPINISEKFNRFILYYSSKVSSIAGALPLAVDGRNDDEAIQCSEELCAWTELINKHEIYGFLGLIRQLGYLSTFGPGIILSAKGYEKLDEILSTNTNSNQVFVAQWFGGDAHKEEMDKLFEDGMSKGVEDCDLGLKAFRIDQKEHNEKICDEIIAEIRRSKLVIADFTCHIIEHEGQSHPQIRGGVYYEAGFAHGLGIPVIFTCRKDRVDALHFDTRQYNHILWETHAELAEKLKQRIRATFNPN